MLRERAERFHLHLQRMLGNGEEFAGPQAGRSGIPVLVK